MALALASGPIFAQAAPAAGRQGQRGNRGGRAVTLATIPVNTLETILKLTADQKTKVAAIQEKFTADVAPLRPQQGQPANPI